MSLFLLVFSGCGALGTQTPEVSPPAVESTGTPTELPEPEKTKGYLFVYEATEIVMDMQADEIQKKLGEAKTYFEAPSFAIEGMMRTYGYGSFEIDTYEVDKKEYIAGVYFKDDTISTQEGAYLFMKEEQLYSIYGTDYKKENGFIVYNKDGMKLKFLLNAGEVTAIQYVSCVSEVK